MIERFISGLTRLCSWAGVIALLIMMFGTDWDVVARQIAGQPLDGVVELVEVTLLATAMLGLPEVFLRDEQIKIDLVDNFLPPFALRLVKTFGLLLTIIFLILLCINVWPAMIDAKMFQDVKYDLGIPIWPLFALIIFAFGASILASAQSIWQLFTSPSPSPKENII